MLLAIWCRCRTSPSPAHRGFLHGNGGSYEASYIFYRTDRDYRAQFLHRARMFRSAAIDLSDIVNGEQNWPKYALLTHAIELALKAFVEHSVQIGQPPSQRAKNHDLAAWYGLALECGLPHDPRVEEHIRVLNELHETHYTRYPQKRATPMPSATNIADAAVDHLIEVITRAISPT
jgi:hypothetical protein